MSPVAWSVLAATAALSCGLLDPAKEMRVSHNPYEEVDWSADHRLVTQFHDHVAADPERIRAYDNAGYDVVSLLDYSGVEMLDYAWRERIWPPSAWLAQPFLGSLESIKFFLPNAEEVGYYHLTSPFLTEYIAKWEPKWEFWRPPSQQRPDRTYCSTQEAFV